MLVNTYLFCFVLEMLNKGHNVLKSQLDWKAGCWILQNNQKKKFFSECRDILTVEGLFFSTDGVLNSPVLSGV